MSKGKRKKSGRERRASLIGRRTLLVVAAVLLAAGILAAAVAFRGGESRQTGSPQGPPAAQGQGAVIAVADDPGFERLNGRWLRPDGGYVLEIRGGDGGGPIEVAYLNPRPINVARAEATRQGSALKVFVELRAPGYPGSTYTLTYDPKRDQLEGTYFQAALRQSFDVVFVRMK